ncbi:MAG: ATP-binding cassette domain-containing protein [Firmicutes bacterium]|nr:ATP-binding cassette domain-containing protein [Bacillota bacterium]
MIKLVKVKKVHVNSGDQRVTALRGINLELPSTGFISLVGENGSGKSTLLNILGGLDTVTSGKMLIDGMDFAKFPQSRLDNWRGREVAYVFQENHLIPDLTTCDNIILGQVFAGEKQCNDRVQEALEMVGMTGYENRCVKNLSGGQRQRIEIARALVKNPKIILFDEPGSHTDTKTNTEILHLLKKISADILVVITSHGDENPLGLADRVIEFRDGQIERDVLTGAKSKKEKEEETESPTHNTKRVSHATFTLKTGVRNIYKNIFRSLIPVLITTLSLLMFVGFTSLNGFSRTDTLAYMAGEAARSSNIFTTTALTDSDMEFVNTRLATTNFGTLTDARASTGFQIIELENQGPIFNGFGHQIISTAPDFYTEGAFGETNNRVLVTDFLVDQIIARNISIFNTAGMHFPSVPTDPNDIIDGTRYLQIGGQFFAIGGMVATDFRTATDITQHTIDNEYMVVFAAQGFMAEHNVSDDRNVNNVLVGSTTIGASFLTDIINTNNPRPTNAIRFGEVGVPNTAYQLQRGQIFVSRAIHLNMGLPAPTVDTTIDLTINGVTRSFTVVGAYTANPEFDNRFIIEMHAADFAEIHRMRPSGIAVASAGLTMAQLSSIIYDIEGNTDLRFQSIHSTEVNDLADTLTTFADFLFWFSLFALALSGVILYNFVNSLLTSKKRDIGIFRSLGARSTTLFGIFFTTVAILVTTIFALTVVAGLILIPIVNGVLMSGLTITATVATLNATSIVSALLVVVGIGLIATTIPVTLYTHQSPMKQLR